MTGRFIRQPMTRRGCAGVSAFVGLAPDDQDNQSIPNLFMSWLPQTSKNPGARPLARFRSGSESRSEVPDMEAACALLVRLRQVRRPPVRGTGAKAVGPSREIG